MAKKEGNETPLMQQYYATKAKYPDAILLYRMGDFYETFGADAITTSRILGITLTKRSSRISRFSLSRDRHLFTETCPCRTAGSYL